MDAFEILSDLTAICGVTGAEERVADAVERYFGRFTGNVRRDALGNVVGVLGSRGPTLLVCAHMDEVGMLVTKIEDDGLLRLCAAGGVDARVLPGHEVHVHGKKTLPAVVGATPPHLAEGDEPSAYTFDELLCDTGLSPEHVRALVSVGDAVTYALVPPVRLQNGRAAGKSFDDRALIAAEILAMERLFGEDLNCRVAFAATTQEEVGQRGAFIATYLAEADLGVAMDVTHAPTPGTKPFGTTEMDKLAIGVGTNIHPKLYAWLTEIAAREGIPFEPEACVGKTGTDAWTMQVQRGGVPSALVSVPLRYMHTSVETIDLATLENCVGLLCAFVRELDGGWEAKLCLDD